MLAEPGGALDATLAASSADRPGSRLAPIQALVEKIRAGDLQGALQHFWEGAEGDGRWTAVPPAAKQQLRDNIFTLLGQADEDRKPFTKSDAQSIMTPTLLIGGTETEGSLTQVLRALAAKIAGARVAMIQGAGHWMFDQAPQRYCEIVTAFLAD